jgi:hypothetical protein
LMLTTQERRMTTLYRSKLMIETSSSQMILLEKLELTFSNASKM